LHTSGADVDTSVPVNASEWRGPEDGLPPVGIDCEVQHYGEWHETKIIGIDDGIPVFKTDWHDRYSYACGSDFKFRPLHTEEDKAVEEMMEVIAEEFNKSGDEWAGTEDIAKAIYAAGYRKQEEPK
jgi:hypothetical protein